MIQGDLGQTVGGVLGGPHIDACWATFQSTGVRQWLRNLQRRVRVVRGVNLQRSNLRRRNQAGTHRYVVHPGHHRNPDVPCHDGRGKEDALMALLVKVAARWG